MHYITLDTNTWIYLANGTEPVRLLNYINTEVNKGNITILLPETVIKEWEEHKDKTVRKGSLNHFKDVKIALNKILKLLGDKGEKDVFSFLLDKKDETDYFKDFIDSFDKKKEEVENAVSANIELIDILFKTKSTIIEIKDKTYVKSGKFAIEKKAPFKQKNSFADALILFSFLEYVETNSIEGAIFISYNTDDFCEKKEGKKLLHSDLVNEFEKTKSHFYKIVGEALNTIKKDIVSKEELELIEKMQEDSEIEFCKICQENNNKMSALYFSDCELIDERKEFPLDPNQEELEFAKGLPKTVNKGRNTSIEIGNCEWCNSEHFKCVDCGSLNAVWEGEFNEPKECEDCGLNYLISRERDRQGFEEIEYSIPNKKETCEKCGDDFEEEDMIENLCLNCEDEYSYGK
ncbi:PIN domain-containing protein [Tenacibaculum ascidiaceicola]|uniref:PIN domain-containing protein n=1 Tax=Tenacibaculum ascidiaceicola TaxID=1699411 RepID=UPI0039E92A36